MILLATTVATLIFQPDSLDVISALVVTLGFGLIGLIDDYIIVVKRRSLGLRARDKLLGQVVLAVLLGLYMLQSSQGIGLYIPFTNLVLNLPPWLYLLLVIGVMAGTANAVNFTDGLDGLAAGATAIASVALAIICVALGALGLGNLRGGRCRSLFGFFLVQFPSRSGDYGRYRLYGLGRSLGCNQCVVQHPFFLLIVGGLFVIEMLSVMLQVTYFRLTGGRRIFRMSPLHHHFELVGWPETKVTFRFWIIGFVFAIIGLLGLPPLLR